LQILQLTVIDLIGWLLYCSGDCDWLFAGLQIFLESCLWWCPMWAVSFVSTRNVYL